MVIRDPFYLEFLIMSWVIDRRLYTIKVSMATALYHGEVRIYYTIIFTLRISNKGGSAFLAPLTYISLKF
jgi:hypothetical protein